ncbi:hypothetical protein [Sphingobacterium sp. SYP-B4668]|uniref:hypothetical protein n=1 Tax=Sphingobacterium sp. SYP-B4668 TaxID=2996035 RepID=UPI000532303D|nr:hypothetical protein [Sphingobacterium sp. SYP-B4668]
MENNIENTEENTLNVNSLIILIGTIFGALTVLAWNVSILGAIGGAIGGFIFAIFFISVLLKRPQHDR